MVVGALMVAGCAMRKPAMKAVAPGGLSVKAMTFNVRVPVDSGERSWESRRAVVAKVLSSRRPDVIGFQEMVPRQREDLLAAVEGYVALGSGREKDRGGESASLFYLRERWDLDTSQTGTFWYSDTPEEPGSNQWQAKWIRVCTWARLVDKASGRGIYVFNNHWDFSEEFHRQASELLTRRIAARIHGDEPVIVMGDLNATPDDKGLAWLLAPDRALPLADTWVLAHPNEPGYSDHNFTGKADKRIDYIFATKGAFSVRQAEVVTDHAGPIWASDHFPVWAEIHFR